VHAPTDPFPIGTHGTREVGAYGYAGSGGNVKMK